MKEAGQIEESNSPWCSPILIVPKKSKQTPIPFLHRFSKRKQSHDQRFVSVTSNWWHFRCISRSLQLLNVRLGSGLFTSETKKEDREKTAFCADNQLYQFKVMPFGLCNAPATFQRLMDRVLRKLTWKYCLVYLDDIIIFARNFEMDLERLELVLIELKRANLKLRPSKCRFFTQKVNYLGFTISKDGLQPNPDKVKAIAALQLLCRYKDWRLVCGLLS